MIHTDGTPTIVSGTSADFAAAAKQRAAETVAEAESITAAAVVKCPNCNAPDNEEPAPLETRIFGLSRAVSIFECQCCELAWHGPSTDAAE